MAVIVAHRGLHSARPENSLSAMKAAWDAGIAWCECDVHLSADGYPVVLHDATLDRTTTGKGPVREFYWRDLQDVRLRDEKGEPADEPLCTMDQILSAMPSGAKLLVELKPELGKLWFKTVDRIFAAGCVVQSFHRADVDLICRTFGRPESTAQLLDQAEDLQTRAMNVNVKHSEITPVVAEQLKTTGKTIGAWTVNSPEEIQRLLGLGVQTIITDNPVGAFKYCPNDTGVPPLTVDARISQTVTKKL